MTVFSDADYTRWLAAPDTRPVTLVSAEHSNGTVYFGTYGYTSTPTDTDPNRHYEDLLLDKIKITESIEDATVGNILLINDGEHEDWIGFNWAGFPIKIYLGDKRWSFDNYRLIVDGRNGGISAPRTNRYKFSILDPHEALSIDIGSELIPLNFGNTFNIRPKLIDAGNRTYKFHDTTVASIVVRDNGVVLTGGGVGYTADLANGEFDLVAAPAGQITVTVVEANTEPEEIIREICKRVPVADEDNRVWDIADAALGGGFNTTTTAFTTGGGSEILTTPVNSDGNSYISVESNTAPQAAARAETTVNALSTVNPTVGTLVFIRGQVRHVGTGGDWYLAASEFTSLSGGNTIIILDLDSTMTDWINFSIAFITGNAVGLIDIIGVRENNGSNDGGAELKGMEIFLSGVSVNTSQLASFANVNNCGLYIQEPRQAGEAIRDVMRTVGGSFRFNTLSQLEIFRLDLPSSPIITLEPDDIFAIEENGIQHKGSEPPVKKMEIGYNKNWNVQSADSLAGSVAIQDREDFSTEFKYVQHVNQLGDFPLAKDKRLGGLFELEADAQTEVDRRQVIRSDKRDLYFVKSYLAPGQVQIGETITINYPDYGFDGGVDVVVLETQRLLGRNKIDLVVWK
jgi:hypothetical protein